jgi:hypothetical protein
MSIIAIGLYGRVGAYPVIHTGRFARQPEGLHARVLVEGILWAEPSASAAHVALADRCKASLADQNR